jgi:putative Mn2+ efflux pump MntP
MSSCREKIWPFVKCTLLAALLFWSLGLYFYIKSLPNARTESEEAKTHEQFNRLKRDFMFAPGHNQTTDSDCFQVGVWIFCLNFEVFFGLKILISKNLGVFCLKV